MLYASPSHSPVLGYAPESLLNHTVLELVHPGDAARVQREIQRLVHSAGRTVITLRFKRVDGDWIEFEAIISAIAELSGAVSRLLLSARDVTERRSFEQALQEKNVELEAANRAKDQFLASMSHELRTPLNAVMGFTGTLLMKLPGPLTQEQTRQLQTIRSSARHLLSLINDLLDLAKVESGKVALNIEPVLFQNLVDEVCSTLRPLAEKKGLELNVVFPEDQVVVNTDRRAVSQVLLNLASNAIKFTEDGEVRIVLARECENEKWWTQLSVHDTGRGIRPEDQTKLFQAFARVETGVRRPEGTGLGLHLSKKMAALLGGQLNFKSEYGKGSTFTLSLPES